MLRKNTKTIKLVRALEKGTALTARQITSRYRLANPASTIDRLRNQEDMVIVSEANTRGIFKYRLVA